LGRGPLGPGKIRDTYPRQPRSHPHHALPAVRETEGKGRASLGGGLLAAGSGRICVPSFFCGPSKRAANLRNTIHTLPTYSTHQLLIQPPGSGTRRLWERVARGGRLLSLFTRPFSSLPTFHTDAPSLRACGRGWIGLGKGKEKEKTKSPRNNIIPFHTTDALSLPFGGRKKGSVGRSEKGSCYSRVSRAGTRLRTVVPRAARACLLSYSVLVFSNPLINTPSRLCLFGLVKKR
jgi:hypothetical protein